MKDGQGMDHQEERMTNKKYRSLKMFSSDIILKFKNIVKFNQNKLLKLKQSRARGKIKSKKDLTNFCLKTVLKTKIIML